MDETNLKIDLVASDPVSGDVLFRVPIMVSQLNSQVVAAVKMLMAGGQQTGAAQSTVDSA